MENYLRLQSIHGKAQTSWAIQEIVDEARLVSTDGSSNSNNSPEPNNLQNAAGDSEPNSEEMYYPMSKENAGICVIVNNVKFSKMSVRDGSEKDKAMLDSTFQKFGYIVKAFDDLISTDIIKVLKKVREDTYSVPNSLCSIVVCILTHGNKDIIYGTDDKSVAKKKIYEIFDNKNCISLRDKPRIYIFQACQGEDLLPAVADDPSIQPAHSGEVDPDSQTPQTRPATSDYLIANAVISGFKALRIPSQGSPFIQELCKALEQHGHLVDFLHILVRVNAVFSGKWYRCDGEDCCIMPEVIYTLTKLIQLKN